MSSETKTRACDECVDELNTNYPRSWNLYQSTEGDWVVQLTLHGQVDSQRSLSSDTLSGVLQSAVDFVPLPLIPHEPKVYREGCFEVVKSGSEWHLLYAGEFFTRYKTKKECLTLQATLVAKSAEAHEKWVKEYFAIVDKGEPGVDFEWSLYS